MVRYPLGGMLSCALQWVIGFQRLGHEVYLVEKGNWENSCYDPKNDVMTDECAYGIDVVRELLSRFGLQDNWCYVDSHGQYHGLSRNRVEEVLRTADIFADYGTHGAWLAEAATAGTRIYIDGEPGYRQMALENGLALGKPLPAYEHFITTGLNIGTTRSSAPTAGIQWLPVPHPVVVDLFHVEDSSPGAPFTTVMNWQSHPPVVFRGVTYGQKDVEFEKIFPLPTKTKAPLEVAVSGKNAPYERLHKAGWKVRGAHDVTLTFNSYCNYIAGSRGELSICKQAYVTTNSGWFSDRSGVYLASGRPVILQDTGFVDCLPSGRGLLAFGTLEEAVVALESVEQDFETHSLAARELAWEYLHAPKVIGRMLTQLGLQ